MVRSRRGELLCVASVFISILVLRLPQSVVAGACVSSCGKITNISYPFRLKGDPDECGVNNYELECRKQQITVLRLFSAEFHVLSINYNNYTIRLVDPNIHNSNCSSIPRYFFHIYNFTQVGPNTNTIDNRFSFYHPSSPGSYIRLHGNIIYLNCTSPILNNTRLEDASSCFGGQNIYTVVDDLGVNDWEIGCHVMGTTAYVLEGSWINDGVSYMDIHRQAVFGFEVSWVVGGCDQHCGGGDTQSCYFNQTGGKVECYIPADYLYGENCHYTILNAQIVYQCRRRILSKFRRYMQAILESISKEIYLIVPNSAGRYGLLSYVMARFLIGSTLLIALLLTNWRRRHLSMYGNIEHFLQDNDLMPIRYSYKQIKKMSRGFKDKLGEGGFGTVYKGKLRSGPLVAIKMLGKSKANGQDFINEVATIGRIHHVHVVRLIGFCVEGSKRALIYEFMPNGSLDKYIFSKEGSVFLSYDKILEISLGVARGIAYLHHGCDKKILHFDIKPHNILLDDNFTPKVSDFGLARLYPIDDSIVTLTAARGTIGYMAPELFYKNIGGISYKADVYSFGMLLMEMGSRRRNLNPHVEHSSQLYFPLWIYDQFIEEKDLEIEDLAQEEKDLAKKMFIVALWCIQLKPIDRPSMNRVVEMLEAQVESLEMPPKPSLYPQETVAEDHEFNSDQTASNSSIHSTSYGSDNILEDNASSTY
ncbi:LEAF RUST 10 DISEASE-RESISTANCE LOCUS RECEPTOR-LIKE PROTEIN KINASE-like 2.1 [Senna tora]|uniref:LEAF RUST 10 DISEASE-RESISTANCE LOCUS RECEPTOR-LIKE PROTEIN KINASE-like 2.1 n=1 Tax=Senna tora TaxID=362788 RepID=A0A834U1Y6_9FABA|nr:LEAF RUST 10 DISEASE-RESISTANCE LOCUS RECEPTOR-LIKE PROTEIN KINASE-like 2.1 [Senna tora]